MAIKVVPLIALAIVAILAQSLVVPKLRFLGILSREFPNINNGNCWPIAGLEACEDQWIHRASGLSYLPCSSVEARKHWVPAIEHFNTSVEDHLPSDEIKLYDTKSGDVSTISISNRPAHLKKLHLHAIDAFTDPHDSDKLTFFINNHGVPKEEDGITAKNAKSVGADSTIEIFETRLGSKTWKWIQSIRDPLVFTPNNIVATGPRSFFVSNDHPMKTGSTRIFALLEVPGWTSGIVHCDATTTPATCKSVAEGHYHPNGLAKGPGQTLYLGSTGDGIVRSYEIQADNSLVEAGSVALFPSPIDNIQVNEHGEIIVALISNAIKFTKRAADGEGPSPAQIWKIGNDTSEQRFHGKHIRTTLLYSDQGTVTPSATNAHLYKEKLYITGLTSKHLMVCEADAFRREK